MTKLVGWLIIVAICAGGFFWFKSRGDALPPGWKEISFSELSDGEKKVAGIIRQNYGAGMESESFSKKDGIVMLHFKSREGNKWVTHSIDLSGVARQHQQGQVSEAELRELFSK